MIFIVIPVFNRVAYTVACIESLLLQSYNDFKIIVVDDGSTDNSFTIVKEKYPNVIVLNTNGNLWWSASMNMGIRYALADNENHQNYVLSLNNDLVVEPDYLSQLMRSAALYPRAIIGSISIDISNNAVEYVGHHWNAYLASKRPAINKNLGLEAIQKSYEHIVTALLPGRGILIPFECFQEVGLFDDAVFPHYAGDHDFTLRAKNGGYKLLINTRAIVYSYVKDTALASMGKMTVKQYLKQSFTSIKSPLNIKTRYQWARRHSATPYLIYFAIDMLRISKSLIVNISKR
jgi:GT2 family glycosyltransferase